MASVVRRTLRCSRAERAEIRERAAALGMRVSGYLVACALHEDAGGPRKDEPRLVLSEEQQRTLYERVEEMDRVRRALGESLSGTDLSVFGAIAFIQSLRTSPTVSQMPYLDIHSQVPDPLEEGAMHVVQMFGKPLMLSRPVRLVIRVNVAAIVCYFAISGCR